ncbi:hypothetical protein D3C77_585970 [compost metagenome]
MASRVVPAILLTITRSSPRSALTSDDLPTFGRPISATRMTSSSYSSSSSSGRLSVIASSKSPTPVPWLPDTPMGSPNPRL